MTPEQATDLVRNSLFIGLEAVSPILIPVLIVGVIVALLQSVTQVSEMTLAFVPKLFAVATALAMLLPWILKLLTRYAQEIFTTHWQQLIDTAQYVG
jgi:flagellar biosynthetic protein FliQ